MYSVYLSLYRDFFNLRYSLFLSLISKKILLKNFNTFIRISVFISLLFKNIILTFILSISKFFIAVLTSKVYNIKYFTILVKVF